MQSLWQYFRSFTVPSFATTGARIVLDGVSGLISVYNSSNVKVAEIGGSDGHILTTDGSSFAELVSGGLLLGQEVSGTPDTAHASIIKWLHGLSNPFLSIVSPISATLLDAVKLTLNPSVGTGAPFGQWPTLLITDSQIASFTQVTLAGLIIHAAIGGSQDTKQVPSPAANWSVGSLKAWLDVEDNIRYVGSISYTGANVAAAGGQQALNSLGTGFVPGAQIKDVCVHYTSTSVQKNVAASAIFNTNGTVSIQWGDGIAGSAHDVNGLATGDIFWLESTIPVGTFT